MRRTTIIPSRFTIFTTNWWANLRSVSVFLVLLVLLSCEDKFSEVGFKNPNADFEVFEKEFLIPTTVFLMDSVSTSNGPSQTEKKRMMVGTVVDPKFGTTTATAYSQFWSVGIPAATYPVSQLGFEKLTLTLMYDEDYYWVGNPGTTTQTYQVYEMTDSLLTYLPHFSNVAVPTGALLGEVHEVISGDVLDGNRELNGDSDTSNDIADSLNIDLDESFGRRLLTAAMDTVGRNELNYQLFNYFRRIFKGIAIKATEADKVVGFNPNHEKTRMTLYYHYDTLGDPNRRKEYQLTFRLSPSNQTLPYTSFFPSEYMNYTYLTTDRSGTALAGLPSKYVDYQPADGLRYIQAGTGVSVKLDFTEVRDHFKNISTKAFSVAELRIETDEQTRSIQSFVLRAIKPNNRTLLAQTGSTDGAGDPITVVDLTLAAKHALYSNSLTRLEPINDSGNGPVSLDQIVNSNGVGVYRGYLTNFLQRETTLTDADFLRFYTLIPQAPDIAKGVNGFYFPADKIKLKVYYTTPTVGE
ncbi:MAG TPA: DUF4270 family protein [Cyclobacteriaceae bacterium]|nr:DUF4270 family protein [Cyclobacteriaceae bacterium]